MRGRRGLNIRPRGRKGAAPRTQPRPTQYDPMDLAVIKAMLDFYTDTLAETPRQAPQLLKKVAVPAMKSRHEINEIIASAFVGEEISAGRKKKLRVDLSELNFYANQLKSELQLKSNLHYRQSDIAKMVHDMAIEIVLEKQNAPVLCDDKAEIDQRELSEESVTTSSAVSEDSSEAIEEEISREPAEAISQPQNTNTVSHAVDDDSDNSVVPPRPKKNSFWSLPIVSLFKSSNKKSEDNNGDYTVMLRKQ
jgi:hypothetical protein